MIAACSALVESFSRRLVASLQQGADLSKVLAALDPDPGPLHLGRRGRWPRRGCPRGGRVRARGRAAPTRISEPDELCPSRHRCPAPARRLPLRPTDRASWLGSNGRSMPASEWSACPSTRPAAPPASRVQSPVRWATASGPAWPSTATAPAGSSSVSGGTTRSASGAAGCRAVGSARPSSSARRRTRPSTRRWSATTTAAWSAAGRDIATGGSEYSQDASAKEASERRG